MEPTSAIFLSALVVTGGLIGALADHLGKTFGKKKLTVFGLRPRQTARLGTVLVGVVTSLLTIMVVLVFSADMRRALLHGTQIRQELDKDRGDLQSLQRQLDSGSKTNSGTTCRAQ